MSLRARLGIVLIALIAVYAVTAVIVVSSQRQLLTDQVDERLRTLPPNAIALFQQPVPPPAPAGEGTSDGGGGDNPLSEIFVGRVDDDGDVTRLVTGLLLDAEPDIAAAISASGEGGEITTIQAVDGPVRFRAVAFPAQGGGWIVAAQSLESTDAAIQRLVRTLAAAGIGIALVLSVAAVWVHRLGLRPIAQVTATAEAITGGERALRVDVRNTHTEAGKLGRAFNVMLDERDAGEARLRQFVADASHELRTPLTSMRGYLQLYAQGAFREEHELNDMVRRLSAESGRMSALVEDLLELASLDDGRPIRQETVDIAQIVRDAAQDARAVQPEREISVDAPDHGLAVTGDPGLLVQLVGILTSNALTHTPLSASVRLSAREDGDGVSISVTDSGPGLSPEEAARVFDRFWRGEASRARPGGARSASGAGLGLAIARSIAIAHGGEITLKTTPGTGCSFVVSLPRRHGGDPPAEAAHRVALL